MSWFHGILSLFSLVLYIAVWVVGLVGVITIFTRYSKPLNKSRTLSTSTPTSTPTFPGVTILRPLKGLDAQLEECLKSAFQQNYPQFEILLSVADEHDPAIKVAKELIKKYPNVVAKLIVGTQSFRTIANDLKARRILDPILKSIILLDHTPLRNSI